MTAKKTRLRWTDEDVRRLRLLADADVGVDTIAKSLGRTRASVKLKAHWFNLSLAQKAPRRRKAEGDVWSPYHCKDTIEGDCS
jgi:hypothetical protein